MLSEAKQKKPCHSERSETTAQTIVLFFSRSFAYAQDDTALSF